MHPSLAENSGSHAPPRMKPVAIPKEPAERKLSATKDLSKYAWFAGQMDRHTCEEFMGKAKDDQFLIRETKVLAFIYIFVYNCV